MERHINLRQMEAFRGVMLTGTTTGAANALNVTQPAISRLIKDLEAQLGVDLFIRRRGRLHATPEAEWLFRESEETLSRIDRLARSVRDIRHVQRGELRLITTPPIAYGLLPGAIKKFYALHPEISVSVQITVRRESRTWVSAQNFDLAIMSLPVEYPKEDTQHLVKMPGVCIFPKNHRLKRSKTVRAEDISGEDTISLLPETLVRYQIDRTLENLGIKQNIRVETQTSSSVCNFVSAGLGIAIIDPLTAKRFIPLGIHLRPFAPNLRFEYGIFFPIRKPRQQIANSFVSIIKQEIDDTLKWYETRFPGWNKRVVFQQNG